jgi:hypothetical protein
LQESTLHSIGTISGQPSDLTAVSINACREIGFMYPECLQMAHPGRNTLVSSRGGQRIFTPLAVRYSLTSSGSTAQTNHECRYLRSETSVSSILGCSDPKCRRRHPAITRRRHSHDQWPLPTRLEARTSRSRHQTTSNHYLPLRYSGEVGDLNRYMIQHLHSEILGRCALWYKVTFV